MVDFENLKLNGFDITGHVETQGWEGFFDRMYGPVYTELVRQFWLFSEVKDKYTITSNVLGKPIFIT